MLEVAMANPLTEAPSASVPLSGTNLDREFDLLEEMTSVIREAAALLVAGLEGERPFGQLWPEISELEHKGDAIARDLFEVLTPLQGATPDRVALQALTGYLDDVIDAIEAATGRLAIHKVRRALPAACEMGQIIAESAKELGLAVHAARRRQDLFSHTRALHRLENRGDDILRDALKTLFAGRRSAKDIIKWKDICEMLEGGTDRCEDIANVLETFAVQAGAEARMVAGLLIMDPDRHETTAGGTPVPLTAKEFSLLHLLIRHQGKVVRRERLLHEVWGEDYFGDSRTLDTHVGWLRKKVETRGGVRILAVRGIGYRLDLQG
jgi:hypothetical protein